MKNGAFILDHIIVVVEDGSLLLGTCTSRTMADYSDDLTSLIIKTSQRYELWPCCGDVTQAILIRVGIDMIADIGLESSYKKTAHKLSLLSEIS